MNTRLVFLLLPAAIIGMSSTLHALEMRTWTSADGRTLQAEFVSFDGTTVTVKDPTGRRMSFNKAKLSQGDLDYIKDVAPAVAAPLGAVKPGKVSNPAKDAKIDASQFKPAGKFEIPQATFDVLETPHFKIMHSPKAKPAELAELAERLWLDTAFFHPTFSQKFTQRKQAIFLVDEETTYLAIGQWYAKLLGDIGNAEAANQVSKSWSRSAAGSVQLPSDIADKNGVLPAARVFRSYEPTGDPDNKRAEKVKGVWVPFRVHCIASDLLDVQTGSVSNFGSGGYFALATGYAYYKEVSLTGKSETSLLSSQSVEDVKATGGFTGADGWPEELKKQIRRKDITPQLSILTGLTPQNTSAAKNVLAYSFIHFLNSSPERTAGWAKLVERISTSNQVPEPDDMAKLLGFENAAAMEKAWIDYLSGSSFR